MGSLCYFLFSPSQSTWQGLHDNRMQLSSLAQLGLYFILWDCNICMQLPQHKTVSLILSPSYDAVAFSLLDYVGFLAGTFLIDLSYKDVIWLWNEANGNWHTNAFHVIHTCFLRNCFHLLDISSWGHTLASICWLRSNYQFWCSCKLDIRLWLLIYGKTMHDEDVGYMMVQANLVYAAPRLLWMKWLLGI